MWTLPLVAPSLFPPTAIDGSSTRAIWLQLMGLVQTVIGLSYLVSCYAHALRSTATNPVPRGATATADWVGDAAPQPVLAVNLAAAGVPAMSLHPVVVAARVNGGRHGDTAVLRHAFHHALLAEANLRRLARLAATRMHPKSAPLPKLALVELPANSDVFDVLPFIWRDEHEVAQQSAA